MNKMADKLRIKGKYTFECRGADGRLKWREKFDKIPENTKDPGLLRAKKDLKRKMPKRSPNEQYWTEGQFQKLTQSPPGRLRSRGPLPWRLLAYMLQASPEVDRVRTLVAKRLSDVRHLESGQRQLERMLLVLWKAGYVELEPPPPKPTDKPAPDAAKARPALQPDVGLERTTHKSGSTGSGLLLGLSGHKTGGPLAEKGSRPVAATGHASSAQESQATCMATSPPAPSSVPSSR